MEIGAAGRSGSRILRGVAPAGVALLVGLELALLAAHPRLPTNDGPAHQYSAWVAHRLASDPADPLAAAFEPNPRRIYPNAAYSWFLQALAGAMPMPRAERLGAALYLIALPLAVGLFGRALGRDPWLPALAAAALALGFPFFMGFFGFLWGVPLTFFFWTVLLGVRERPGAPGLLAANALAGLLFCAHLVAFAVAMAGGLVLIASGPWRRRTWLALAGMLPVAAVSPWFWPRTVAPAAGLRWAEGPLDRLVSTATLAVGSSFGGAERTGATLAGLGLGAAVALAFVARRGGPEQRGLAPLTVALLGLSLAAPSAIGSGSFLAERLMFFTWLTGIVALGALGARARAAAALGVLVLALVHAAFLEARCRDFDRESSVYLSALDRIPAGGALYAFIHTPPHEDFVAQPMATAPCHYFLALGSANFGLYQAAAPDSAYFPVRFRESVRRRFPRDVPRDRIALGRAAPWADYLLLWQASPRELARVERTGLYRLDFERDRLRLYRRAESGVAVAARPPGDAGGD